MLATIGPFNGTPARSPKLTALPRARTRPRSVKIQYPPPDGVTDSVVTCSPLASHPFGTDPYGGGPPFRKTRPMLSTIRYRPSVYIVPDGQVSMWTACAPSVMFPS